MGSKNILYLSTVCRHIFFCHPVVQLQITIIDFHLNRFCEERSQAYVTNVVCYKKKKQIKKKQLQIIKKRRFR